MNRLLLFACTTSLALVFPLCPEVSGWEVELEGQVVLHAAVVRLGDISRITGLSTPDTQLLEKLVLSPGPSRSYTRSLSSSQIRKILSGRGVELDACHFTGAPRCLIVCDPATPVPAATKAQERGETAAPESTNPWNLVRPADYRGQGGTMVVDRLEKQLADAVQARFQELSGESVPWNVEVALPSRAFSEIPKQWEDLAVEGPESVTEGRHQLVACFTSGTGDVRVNVEAVATRMVELVVPVRPLTRGDVIAADDVELRYVAASVDQDQAVRHLEDVVGQQVQLSVGVGQPMRARSLKRPILVKRRETVEVISRRGGIVVRTKVRAIDDGALGDTIAVERLEDDKARFLARVVGVQRVEVCASNTTTQRIAVQ